MNVALILCAAAVRASTFGWNAADATECLTKALTSGVEKVVIDRQMSDWVLTPVRVSVRDVEIVLEDGVVLRAKKDAFHHPHRGLLCLNACRNVVLRGEGTARFVMNKPDYQDPSRYSFSEWRDTLTVLGGENITVRNLTFESSGGDGIYLGQNVRNVLIEDVTCRDHHRQGMSITGASGVTVRRSAFVSTKGTAPQCGVDLEPNCAEGRLEDILFEDCTFAENAASGFFIHALNMTDRSRPVSVMLRRCRFDGNRGMGVGLNISQALTPSVRGRVSVENCSFAGNAGGGLSFSNLVKGGVEVFLKDCELDVGGTEALVLSTGYARHFAGLHVENVRFRTDRESGIVFRPYPGAGAENCSGVLTFVKDGRETAVDLAEWAASRPRRPELLNFRTAPVDFRSLVAATGGKLDRRLSSGRIRNGFTLIQCVPAAGDYTIGFRITRTAKDRVCTTRLHLYDAQGTDLGVRQLPEGESEVVLKANGPGLFRMVVSMSNGSGEAFSDMPGFGLMADSSLELFGRPETFHFEVPADAESVSVEIRPEEPCSARLFDASGTVVAEKAYSQEKELFLVKRAKTAEPEIWRLEFPKVAEDARFRIGAPALPIVSPSAKSAIRSLPFTGQKVVKVVHNK